jgi:hypothetical protein
MAEISLLFVGKLANNSLLASFSASGIKDFCYIRVSKCEFGMNHLFLFLEQVIYFRT